MKQFLLIFIVLCSLKTYSQTVIFNEKIIQKSAPVGFNFLPNANRIVIETGKFGDNANESKTIENIFSYDSDGFFEKLAEYESFSGCYFSPTEKSFLASKRTKSSNEQQQFKLILDGLASPYFNFDPLVPYFNDVYQFGFINQKNEPNIDFENDDLLLNVTVIDSKVNQKIKIQKPNIERLINKEQANYANKITFSVRVNEDTFGLISKSIKKDYKTAILYRSIYDYAGKQLNDFSYQVTLPDNTLIYSDNGGGNIYTNTKTNETYISDLTINNFVTDPATRDVFVYGLFGENAKNASNIFNKPIGFYVFKFDKSGNKIWHSIQTIDAVEPFRSNQNITKIKLEIALRKNDIVIKIHNADHQNKYMLYSILENNTGSLIKNSNIPIKANENNKFEKAQFLSQRYIISDLKNKFFDKESLFAYSDNKDFKYHIDSISNENIVFFKSFLGKQGIWLLESDNSSYYKAVFFKQ